MAIHGDNTHAAAGQLNASHGVVNSRPVRAISTAAVLLLASVAPADGVLPGDQQVFFPDGAGLEGAAFLSLLLWRRRRAPSGAARALSLAALLCGCSYPHGLTRTPATGTPATAPASLSLAVLYAGSDAREASADQGGNVWIATASGVRVALSDGGLLVFTQASANLASDAARTVAGGPAGQCLVGFEPQEAPGAANPPQLNYLTLDGTADAGVTVEAFPFNLTGEVVQANHAAFDPRRDQFWIGTNEGLSLFDSARDVLEHRHPVHPHGLTNGVAITRHGDVWDGDEFQLSRLNAGPQADFSATFDPVLTPFPLAQQNLSALALDAAEHVWAASLSQGLAVVDADAMTATLWDLSAGLPSLLVQAVAVDPDGSVWVGTADRGLGRLAPSTGRWQVVDATSGLGSQEVRDLAVVTSGAGGARRVAIVTGAGVATYSGP